MPQQILLKSDINADVQSGPFPINYKARIHTQQPTNFWESELEDVQETFAKGPVYS